LVQNQAGSTFLCQCPTHIPVPTYHYSSSIPVVVVV
jgi:hypothetical protein